MFENLLESKAKGQRKFGQTFVSVQAVDRCDRRECLSYIEPIRWS